MHIVTKMGSHVALAGLLVAGPSAPAWAASARITPTVLAVQRVAPAVVHIATDRISVRAGDGAVGIDPAEEAYAAEADAGLGADGSRISLGSGIIFDRRGYVLTNLHVVQAAASLSIIIADGRALAGEIIGRDEASDLAILRVRAGGDLTAADLGTSSDLRIGETLLVLGNPYALSHSVTVGVLSAIGRSVRAGRRVFTDFLQTDAAINRGNSGGPIVNLDGEVVGIATAIHAEGEGIGFAIPIDRAKRIVHSLLRDGTAQPAWIGLETKPAGEGVVRALGLGPGQGLIVTHAVPSGPAAAAGIVPGDVVVEAAGQPLRGASELDARLWNVPNGGALGLVYVRDGRRTRVEVKPLEARSPRLARIAAEVLGFQVGARPPGGKGVVVETVAATGPGASRGFARGDIIYELDGQSVDSVEQWNAAFYQALIHGTAMVLVQHGEAAYYIPLLLE